MYLKLNKIENKGIENVGYACVMDVNQNYCGNHFAMYSYIYQIIMLYT